MIGTIMNNNVTKPTRTDRMDIICYNILKKYHFPNDYCYKILYKNYKIIINVTYTMLNFKKVKQLNNFLMINQFKCNIMFHTYLLYLLVILYHL